MQKGVIVYIFLLPFCSWICISLCNSETSEKKDLFCYQCADSTGDPAKATCQNYKRLKKDRVDAEKDNRIGRYFKNCTSLNYNDTYCIIEVVMSRGDTFSYIRDCSDGKSFSVEVNAQANVLPDNQTTCGYRGDGYLVCITLCDSYMCNGPTGGATDHAIKKFFMLLPLTFSFLYKRLK